jgi:hypothetical protein
LYKEVGEEVRVLQEELVEAGLVAQLLEEVEDLYGTLEQNRHYGLPLLHYSNPNNQTDINVSEVKPGNNS